MKLLKKYLRRFFIFGSISRPIIPFYINLLYFKGNEKNVGDYLSKVIFNDLMKKKNKSFWSIKTKRISFIGSVIQFIGGDTIVYGSGLMKKDSCLIVANKKLNLDIRAVRGPLTKKSLESVGYTVPDVFGDPAILLPLFYQPREIEKRDYIVIPHWKKMENYNNYPVLSPITHDWKNFIDVIASTKLVISASLHGIIIAETYGVPAIMLGDTEHSDIFKYIDYYKSTGRDSFPIAKNIEEALSMNLPAIPNHQLMRDSLLKSFPF